MRTRGECSGGRKENSIDDIYKLFFFHTKVVHRVEKNCLENEIYLKFVFLRETCIKEIDMIPFFIMGRLLKGICTRQNCDLLFIAILINELGRGGGCLHRKAMEMMFVKRRRCLKLSKLLK